MPHTQRLNKRLGSLPIMVKSAKCYLRHMGRKELIRSKEEGNEFGGYFICNGIERIIRMLVQVRQQELGAAWGAPLEGCFVVMGWMLLP